MAERPSDRAIAQAVRWASDELRSNGSDASIPLCAAVELIVTKAIELDAAPSEPVAVGPDDFWTIPLPSHWRRAIGEWGRDPVAGNIDLETNLNWIEQRARELAREGK